MSSSKVEIDQALLDVRKAYRLLHDYQRAALDAVKYIGSQLGFTYNGGSPRFSSCAPRPGKGQLNLWAWDWLNIVCHDFDFISESKEPEVLGLKIRLFSAIQAFLTSKVIPLHQSQMPTRSLQ